MLSMDVHQIGGRRFGVRPNTGARTPNTDIFNAGSLNIAENMKIVDLSRSNGGRSARYYYYYYFSKENLEARDRTKV